MLITLLFLLLTRYYGAHYFAPMLAMPLLCCRHDTLIFIRWRHYVASSTPRAAMMPLFFHAMLRASPRRLMPILSLCDDMILLMICRHAACFQILPLARIPTLPLIIFATFTALMPLLIFVCCHVCRRLAISADADDAFAAFAITCAHARAKDAAARGVEPMHDAPRLHARAA